MNPVSDLPIQKSSSDLQLGSSIMAASGQQMRCTDCRSVTLNDPELARVIQDWNNLPMPVKRAILTLVAAMQEPGAQVANAKFPV